MTSSAGNEEWKDVRGWEGFYKVSRSGKVYSLKSGKTLKESHQDRYPMVILHKNGKRKRVFVHRLVAEAFIDNPEGKPQVDHINGDTEDNRVENLRWVTVAENNSYARGVGVECIEENMSFISFGFAGRWLMESDRSKAKTEANVISKIIKACRTGRMAYGYHWRYTEDGMGRMSREKGKRGEREVANILKERGYDAKRGVQYQGSPDSPDVVGLPGAHIEVKRTERLDLYSALEQCVGDSGSGETPVVVHRRNNKDWVAVLRLEDFLDLYEKRPNCGARVKN